ncbi:PaaX family transcriptional regulator C-terminal domain-containing protein [Gluconacetobacter sacchari]|uniref:Phenylacetic acid degradation operon negative regulatory protein PaaX n=2 Tax=Gluconacetobacter sacchari TaxID=92759 RepID=A0A7W4ICS1_9PROT|nr:PaaX family transcriptional regulator C-terminal domain-containing protein [Gluconacetobacter sacchari]MBB2160479.1 phenylacetic acid degradation operon negative regulatory protein PaaX [Gluconacetobacter sacchari]
MTAPATAPALAAFLDAFGRTRFRLWSVIITIYGDAILPRGGSVWVGTLLALCRGMEVEENAVRTAMSRLAADGWVSRTRHGRNSFYALAPRGREAFLLAAEHIYRERAPLWTGHLTMVMPDASVRETAFPALAEAGFGSPLGGLFVAPGGRAVPPGAACPAFALSGPVEALRGLAARAWPLEDIAREYQAFLDAFAPCAEGLDAGAGLDDLGAMVARIVLIHAYRRIVLRDPLLPAELLPADWPGERARAVCGRIYDRLRAGSERWLDENAVGEDGAPLPAGGEARFRF